MMINEVNNIPTRSKWAFIYILLSVLIFGNFSAIAFIPDLKARNFLFLAIIALVYFVGRLRDKEWKIRLNVIDIGWVCLIVWMFASYLWATNPALSLFYSFGWFSYFLIYLVFKDFNFTERHKEIIAKIFLVSFLLLGILFLLSIYRGHLLPKSFTSIHRNVISVNLTVLFPFAVFATRKMKFKDLWQIGIICLLYSILLYTNCRGAVISATCVLIVFRIYNSKKYFNNKVLLGLISVGILGLLVLYYSSLGERVLRSKLFSEFHEDNEFDRLYMLRNTWWMFCDHPFLGVGGGSWRLEAYSYGLSDFSFYDFPLKFVRQESHNAYAKMLGELGIFGLIFFLVTFLYPIKFAIRKFKTINEFGLSLFSVLIIFYIHCSVFATSTFLFNRFSVSLFVTVISLALISKSYDKNIVKSEKGLLNYLVLLIAFLVVLFHGYYYFHEKKLDSYKMYKKDKELYVEKLESAYISGLKNTHHLSPIPITLARQSRVTEDLERTKKYYEEALLFDPYNVEIIAEYGTFLVENLKDYKRAEELALVAFRVHPKHYDTRILMARIELRKGNKTKVEKYLDFYEELKQAVETFESESQNRHNRIDVKSAKKFKRRKKILKTVERITKSK